jgi:cytochrome c551/c552
MLLGTLMVVAGTRESSGETMQSANAGCLAEYCRPPRSAAGLMERGAAIERTQCAGCHSGDRREIGPSYAAIAARYHCSALELSLAMGHPRPGWADYPSGPTGPRLGPGDRTAVVYWILGRGARGND